MEMFGCLTPDLYFILFYCHSCTTNVLLNLETYCGSANHLSLCVFSGICSLRCACQGETVTDRSESSSKLLKTALGRSEAASHSCTQSDQSRAVSLTSVSVQSLCGVMPSKHTVSHPAFFFQGASLFLCVKPHLLHPLTSLLVQWLQGCVLCAAPVG